MTSEPLPRHKPEPIPPIQPLPERLATGQRRVVYEDTKTVLQVPWMGVVTMAFAHYPQFYETLWHGIRPLCASAPFVEACTQLRQTAETAAATLGASPLAAPLDAMGYDVHERDTIRALIEIFSHGNMPYLLIATAARLLLEGEALSTAREAPAFAGRHGPEAGGALTLVESHHADAALRALYADIRETLGLPFVNTDYRALARWPSYFDLAWDDLKGRITTPDYAPAVASVHDKALSLMRTLPNPGGLTHEALADAAARDGDLAEIRAVVRLFQWLLPGLATNVAVFRAQLVDEADSAAT